ncbi:MAG: DUF4405 domain-containing protein [archaeon]
MEKGVFNYLIDILMAITFVFSATTALVIFFFLPEGVRQGRYQEFLGLTKGTWSFVHTWAGIAFIVLLIIHFILHWNWLICMSKSIFRNKNKELKGGKKQ